VLVCRLAPHKSHLMPPAACFLPFTQPLHLQLGLVGEQRAASFHSRRQEIEDAEQLLDSIQLSTSSWARQGFQVSRAAVKYRVRL